MRITGMTSEQLTQATEVISTVRTLMILTFAAHERAELTSFLGGTSSSPPLDEFFKEYLGNKAEVLAVNGNHMSMIAIVVIPNTGMSFKLILYNTGIFTVETI